MNPLGGDLCLSLSFSSHGGKCGANLIFFLKITKQLSSFLGKIEWKIFCGVKKKC